ncbi:ferric reductase like transmembrane component-domain-containing protein [Hyaloscypha sp. PMI_1271]|nr:ferric reductase like transmembrane component-domain-containing protein [Hyaloscypha sp. PMI_1271]
MAVECWQETSSRKHGLSEVDFSARYHFFLVLGHAPVFTAYITINITLLLQHLDLSVPWNWAKRMGWITACNIALITFLALKNTPLAYLTAYSYDRLNILHQAAGYCTVLFTMLHAVLYIVTDSKLGSLSDLLKLEQIMGIVAGFAMLSMLTTALTLRRIRYEAFYTVHIIMFMLVIIAVSMHRSEFQMKAIYIIIFSACIWGSDRLLRGLRMVVHAFGNRAHAYPLPHGGIRIVRAIETHPFTILSTSPLEVVITSQDGFTRDLFSLASKRPGALLIASCDGPYGTLPNLAKLKHVVLVAGGSGATFTIDVALNLIHQLPSSGGKPMIHFIWVIQDQEMKNWFEKELVELSLSPLVKLTIYVTRTFNARTPTSERQNPHQAMTQASNFETSDAHIADPEKSACHAGPSGYQRYHSDYCGCN